MAQTFSAHKTETSQHGKQHTRKNCVSSSKFWGLAVDPHIGSLLQAGGFNQTSFEPPVQHGHGHGNSGTTIAGAVAVAAGKVAESLSLTTGGTGSGSCFVAATPGGGGVFSLEEVKLASSLSPLVDVEGAASPRTAAAPSACCCRGNI